MCAVFTLGISTDVRFHLLRSKIVARPTVPLSVPLAGNRVILTPDSGHGHLTPTTTDSQWEGRHVHMEWWCVTGRHSPARGASRYWIVPLTPSVSTAQTRFKHLRLNLNHLDPCLGSRSLDYNRCTHPGCQSCSPHPRDVFLPRHPPVGPGKGLHPVPSGRRPSFGVLDSDGDT